MTDRAHLAFATALHRVAAPDPSVDACWSPYSVASALALAMEAARGETRAELEALLGPSVSGLLAAAADVPELSVANTLWASDELVLNPDFSLASSARSAPFSSDPETVRKLVNTDVAETTHGLIPELLSPGAVSASAVAMIVNALYLKVGWLNPFTAIGPRPFRGVGDVPTMNVTAKFRYARHPGWQTIVLPAASGVEAVVLLPDSDLTEFDPAFLEASSFVRLDLSMPRLNVRMKASLKDALIQLGVWSLFSPSADFSGLSPDPRMYLDDVIHEAVLRVDEQGLEGAAATAAVFRMVSVEIEADPIVVQVDRPFLLLVRHAASGAIYFMTRVVHP
ncbi:serine protease [Lentzea sp. NBRC 105346]|uniref:serpin family protein n=1 Tax=Lentzea sp. NBRC 105346 TaxID=3032205 RepID=UPI002554062C|nr:serpin family protein [Lentzea sp. NBRC 105346]GLZ33957.1 serine protease [Lentzea sp. NBRC 105346]